MGYNMKRGAAPKFKEVGSSLDKTDIFGEFFEKILNNIVKDKPDYN